MISDEYGKIRRYDCVACTESSRDDNVDLNQQNPSIQMNDSSNLSSSFESYDTITVMNSIKSTLLNKTVNKIDGKVASHESFPHQKNILIQQSSGMSSQSMLFLLVAL